ncbi:hypothetical protein Angca_006200 [Angiostrongylus cantonensis]|uniref:Transthyretin-like family protein n=1 Tax=Angiostrongylus cantonensis TaxID=6313 RepID=A0A0K0CYV3_ANGCA|nr:hypothetical protein Angca_006200 [Angiostrongylus cantonensis]
MVNLVALMCLLSTTAALPFIGTVQSVAVTGKLTCNGKPAENVKVKLYEKEVVLDTLLDEKFSDSKGTFTLSGNKKELTTIDPKVNIYHKCNYEGLCFKKISVKIPKNFVTEGEKADKVFDIGELNLAGAFSGESIDCLN